MSSSSEPLPGSQCDFCGGMIPANGTYQGWLQPYLEQSGRTVCGRCGEILEVEGAELLLEYVDKMFYHEKLTGMVDHFIDNSPVDYPSKRYRRKLER